MANDFLVRVGADLSAFISEMEKIGVEVDKAVKDAEKSFAGFERLGDKLTGIGTALTVGITAPLGLMAGAAISAAGEFGGAMNKVKANLDDVSASGIAQLDALAKKLGADTKFSALEAAQGMGEFAAAGRTTSEILSVMRPALDLAAAAQTNVAQASQITNDILGQFGLKAGDAKGVIDLLAKAGTESSGSLLEMANSLSYVGPIAAKSGVDVGQTAAALVELDKAGVRGEKAGTALRAMLLALADPSKEAQRTINALGISTKDASGNFLPFPQILDNFKAGLEKAGGSAQQLGAVSQIFGRETATAASILIGQGGPALTAYEEKLKNSEGAARKMADTLNSGMKGAFEQLRGSVETVAISFGQVLEPIVVRGANILQGFVDNVIAPAVGWFGELPAPIQYTALGLAALAAAAGPVILGAGLLISGFASVGSSLALINAALLPTAAAFSAFATTAIAPVVAAIAGFVTTTIPAFVLGVGEMVMAIGMQATAALIQFSSTQVPQLVASLASAAAGFVTLAATIVTEAITALSTFALTSIPAAAAAVVAFVTTTIPAAVSAFASFAVAGVGAVASALSALATVSLPYIVGAVAIAAAAFGAWKLAEWALTTEPVKKAIAAIGDVINWLIDQIKKIPGVTAIIETLKGASEKVGTAFEKAKEQGKKLWDTMNGAGNAAAGMKPHLDLTGEAAKAAAKAQRELEEALRAFGLEAQGGSSKVDALKNNLGVLHNAWVDGKVSSLAYWEALQKYNAAIQAADPATVKMKSSLELLRVEKNNAAEEAKKLEAAMRVLQKAFDDGKISAAQLQQGMDNYKSSLDKLYPSIYALSGEANKLTESLRSKFDAMNAVAGVSPEVSAGLEQISTAANDAAANSLLLRNQINDIVGRMAAEVTETDALRAAYRTLGVESSESLRQKAASAREAYNAIVEAGETSPAVIHEAWERMRKAELDAMSPFARTLQESFDSIGQTVGSMIGGLFGGGLSSAQKNKISGLTGDLEAASQDFAAYIDDITSQIDGLDAKYEASAAKQIAAERKALDKKQADFDQYAAEVAGKLEGLDDKYEAAAAKQIVALVKGLDKAAAEYDKYADNAEKSLEQITKKHSDELDKQKRDAERSLSDKLKDLEDYQRDAATKLSRVTEDLAAKNQKEEQDYRDSLARKALDLDQYRATVQQKLQQMAGDNSASATRQREDLLLSLQQREQDFLLWKNQAAAHLEAVTTANTTQANRQRTDIQTSLADRQSDFAQYKADTEAKITELSAAHAAKAEEERAAIQAKLVERTADFEQYKLDVQTKIEEAKQTAITKAQEERDGLLAKLNEKKADFDAYKAEMAAKIEEIKQAAITKAQEEKEALKTKLDEKTADFEQYKVDVNAKIEEIRKENETKTGDMATKWGNFTKDAGLAVGGMATGILDKLFRKSKPDSVASQNDEVVPGMVGAWESMSTAIGGTMGSLATNIGNKLFTGEGSWVEVGKAALLDLAGAFVQMGISWVSEATGLASKISGIFSSIKIPALPSIPGLGGGGGGATTGATTGGGDIAGAVAGAVSSSLTGIVGAVGGVVSAVSGVVGNFQMKAMNEALDNIVKHTLQTANDLANLRRDEWTREGHNMAKWDDIWNAILGINSWDAPVIHKLDSIWDAILDLGGVSGGGGGTGTAALQSIEASATAINDQISGFRGEVSTGFYNMAVQGDGVINELRAIAGNTKPTPAGALSVVAPNLEDGLRNINLTSQGIYNALSPLKDIRDTLGAMRNNIGVVNGIKEALVGQLGLMYKSLEETSGSLLREIARNTYPVYQVYDRIWKSINTASTSTGGGSAAVAGARPISVQVTIEGAMVTTEIAEEVGNVLVARLRNLVAA